MKIGKFDITKWSRKRPEEWRRKVFNKDYIGTAKAIDSFNTGYAGCIIIYKYKTWHLNFGWNIFAEEYVAMYGIDASRFDISFSTLKEAKAHVNLFLRKLKKLKAFI